MSKLSVSLYNSINCSADNSLSLALYGLKPKTEYPHVERYDSILRISAFAAIHIRSDF